MSKRGKKCVVCCVPKTIDNDVLLSVKVQGAFNLGSDAVACIARRSCPSLGLSEGRGAEIARRE